MKRPNVAAWLYICGFGFAGGAESSRSQMWNSNRITAPDHLHRPQAPAVGRYNTFYKRAFDRSMAIAYQHKSTSISSLRSRGVTAVVVTRSGG